MSLAGSTHTYTKAGYWNADRRKMTIRSNVYMPGGDVCCDQDERSTYVAPSRPAEARRVPLRLLLIAAGMLAAVMLMFYAGAVQKKGQLLQDGRTLYAEVESA